MGVPSLYLSYSRYETEFAIKLATDLKNSGIGVWCDRLRLSADHDLRAAVKQAVLDANVVVCVISPTYLTSRYARHEWSFARKNGKILLPLIATPVDSSTAPSELELRRALDFKGWRDEMTYKTAFARLKAMFGEMGVSPPSALDRYLNEIICAAEMHLAGDEILDLPDQMNSPTATAALRPVSSLEPVWGKVGEVLLSDQGEDTQTKALTDVVNANARLMLLGKPGSGKTTALIRLALDQSYAYRARPDAEPLPLYIHLADWQDDVPFQKFLETVWIAKGIEEIGVLSALHEGRILLLLDGLTEFEDTSQFQQKAAALKEYIDSESAPQRMIVAGRTGIDFAEVNLGLPVYEIQPLSDTAIRAVVGAQLGDAASLLLDKLFAPPEFPLRENPSLVLARTIGDLAGLIFLHRIYPTHELPRNTGALHKRLVPLMWVWRRIAQSPYSIPHKELTAALSDLALHMIDRSLPSIAVTAAESVVGILRVGALKAACEMRILDIHNGQVRFINRVQRDYFAGLALSRLDLVMRLSAPRFDPTGSRIAGKWDEVARLMCGAAPKADALLRDISEVDPLLAAQLMRELFMPIPTHLLKVLRDWDWQPNEQIANELRDPSLRLEAETVFLPYLEDADPQKRDGAAWALSVIGDQAVNSLISGQTSEFTAEGTVKLPWNKPAQPQPKKALAAPAAPPTRVGELLKQLFSPDWQTRQGAVVALGESGDDTILLPLIETLSDPDEHVRFAAVRALERYQGDVVVDGLLRALRDENYLVKDAAGEALGKLGTAALPGLLGLLEDSTLDVDTKGVIVETLGVIADPLAVPALSKCLEDDSVPHHEGTRISELAAAALERIGSPESMSLAAEWRGEQQPTEEIVAVVDLSTSDTPVDVSALQDAPPAPEKAADRPEETVQKLLDELNQPDPRKQHAAAKALGEYTRQLRGTNSSQVLRLLEQAVGQKDDYIVRWAAVEALGWYGDDEALPTLQEALHDQHFTVKLAAIRALQEIGASTAMWSLMHCLGDSNRLVREKAAEALGRIGDEEAAPRLTEVLKDDEPFVRRAAAESLGLIGSHKSAPALIELLNDQELLVRWAAAEALGKLGEPAAVQPLAAWLSDEAQPSWSERRVCDLAADALERIPTPEAVAALEKWRSRLSKN